MGGNSSNRVRAALAIETTRGTLPASPRFRSARMTGESLKITQNYKDSGEIRPDRMEADPVPTNATTDGSLNQEFYFPTNLSPLSETMRSVMYNDWTLTAERDNDLTAASAITAITATQFTVASGAPFLAGNLLYSSGQNAAANNGLFVLSAGTATTAVTTGLVVDAAPAPSARIKVVGQQGASGDIAATATGLSSTTLDFTTLGLAAGRWLKLANFATVANNKWVRVAVAPTAHAIVLDNLPAGWAADAGTGKTIQIFFGDQIKNGVLERSLAIERGFLDQATPTYILQLGMIADKWDIKVDSGSEITQSFDWMGMSGSQGQVANGASYDGATTSRIMAANANVGAVIEAGISLSTTNPVKSIEFILSNGQTAIDDVTSPTPAGTSPGSATVTGTLEVNFRTNDLLAKVLGGTATSLSARAQRDNQAIVIACPRATYNSDGQPNATARNTLVTQKLGFKSTFDAATNAQILVDRFEFYV